MNSFTFAIVSAILLSSICSAEVTSCASGAVRSPKCDLDASTKVGICSCYMGYQNDWLEAESITKCEASYGISLGEKSDYCSEFVGSGEKIDVQKFTAYAEAFVSVCKKDIVMNKSKPPSSEDISYHVKIDFSNLSVGIRQIGEGLMAVGDGFTEALAGMRAVIAGAAQVYGVLISAIPWE